MKGWIIKGPLYYDWCTHTCCIKWKKWHCEPQLPINVWKVKYPLHFIFSYVQPVTQQSRTVEKAPKCPLQKNTGNFHYEWKPSRATTKSTSFTVNKDEWDTKEDTGKSMKNALYVLRYAKRACIRLKPHQTVKKVPVALAVIQLRLSEGISSSVSLRQSVKNSIKKIKIP